MKTKHNKKILFVYPGISRKERLKGVETGESPEDFFYGYIELLNKGYDVDIADSRKNPIGFLTNLNLRWEIIRNRVNNIGLSKERVKAIEKDLNGSHMAISFTDWFSISLGLYAEEYLNSELELFGGFHGLSDLPEKAGVLYKTRLIDIINKSSKRLDHMFFFGEEDRKQSIKRYGIPKEKTSLFPFGIDTEFWCVNSKIKEKEYLLSVGSDPARDYKILVDANINFPINIITRLKLDLNRKENITLIQGSFYGSNITDSVLRDIYRESTIVIVPIKDVFQPSGYSVTLQAMACGKPVILSKIKGLWDPEVFIDGYNCMLVKPGSVHELKSTAEKLIANKELRDEIGKNARETAEKHFSVSRMNDAIVKLVSKSF